MGITSPDKGWIEANDKICDILGYSREELFKTTWDKITYPDDLDKDLEQFNRILNGYIDSYSLEKRFIRKDGSVIYTNLSGGCIRNEDNSVKYFVVMIEDITERKKAEENLKEAHDNLEIKVNERTRELQEAYELLGESELKFREIFNKANDMITLNEMGDNFPGKFIEINEVGIKRLGYNREELLNMTPRDIVAPDKRPEMPENAAETYKKQLQYL